MTDSTALSRPLDHAGCTLLATGGLVAALMWWTNPSLAASFTAAGAYFAAAMMVLAIGARGGALRRFGHANRITWLRTALAAMLAGFAIDASTANAAIWWGVISAACIALALDGLDGFVARRRNECTAFGARFDMETDAALILVLTVLVWQSGKTGSWVLIIGAMRYVFIAVGHVYPILTSPLPPSIRRKLVCVGQVVGLVLCLLPIIPTEIASFMASLALAALTLSFAKDVMTLIRPEPNEHLTGRTLYK
ncbi:MAG: CDP-alcohol phosphatidyltransferase family protein [Rhodospirillaceae bacterium]|jgi:phosphatidylglycerophosphate synthase|nr:CDP-alcohol phosphatidyltransferase family protein [Rhodospirillaceae bacterium]MBT5812492.1 CDP-alcohol phosphatidyltransferase family protein [Rhodospirillaceae bacterium]